MPLVMQAVFLLGMGNIFPSQKELGALGMLSRSVVEILSWSPNKLVLSDYIHRLKPGFFMTFALASMA